MPIEVFQQWWPLILSGVAVVVWVVRMEAKMLANSRDIERLWAQRRDDLEAAKTDRQELKDMLKEVRDDIKELAKRPAK